MTTAKLEAILLRIIERKLVDRGRVQTFQDAGILTRDKGLVLRVGDRRSGDEFQITIVRSN